MYKYRLLFVAIAVLLASTKLSAQTITSNDVHYGPKAVDVNMMELSNYEKLHSQPVVRKLPFDESNESGSLPLRPDVDPSMIRMRATTTTGHTAEGPHSALMPVSTSAIDSFEGKISDGSSIPPDTHGAVDSLYAVTAINSSVTIQNRFTHAVVSSVLIDNFWTSMETHGPGAYDPRVFYDPNYKRWIILADAYGETNNSAFFFAVSATGNPTGTWHMYKIDLSSSTGKWMDFPTCGFNNRWVTVSGNFFAGSAAGGGYLNDELFVIDYVSMMSGGTLSYGTLNPPGSSFTLCPAVTYDAAESNMFCLESYNPGGGQLRLFKITGNIGALSLVDIGNPTAPSTLKWQQSNGSGDDFVPQLGGGTSYLLQANDDRVNNVTQRNGTIWCAHTAFLPATGTVTRVAAQWWQIDSTGTPAQVGRIDDPTTPSYYWFPSISVNISNDALIGFAASSALIHPSCAYALHLHTDATDSTRTPFIYRHGQQIYFQNFTSSVSTPGDQDRWGDYSQTCVDPRNNIDFCTVQETVPPFNAMTAPGPPNSNWDTWWAYVKICTPLSAVPTPSIVATSPCTGTIALYSVDTVAGATSYVWTVSGTGWSGTSTTDSIHLTVGTGVATITVAPANSCATGTGIYTFTITPSPLAVEVMTVTPSPICTSATSALFTTTATGGPTSYSWTVLGTGWSGSSTTSSLTAAIAAGAGTGTIIVNGTNGCGVGPNDTMVITPSSGPAAPSPIMTPSLVCASTTGVFSISAIAGATGYSWSVVGTGWSGSSTTTSVTATIGTGTGYIIVNATDGCGTGPNDTLAVVASTGPTAPTSITSTSTVYCSGSTMTFSTPAIPGVTSYIWSVSGAGWSTTGTSNTVTVTVGTGTATITVIAVNPCGNSTAYSTAGLVPTITPSAAFIESVFTTTTHMNVICAYTGTMISGVTYLWNFDGGIATPGTGVGPQTVHWNTAGIYTVTLTVDNDGCSATFTDTVHVNESVSLPQVVTPSFDASITPNPNDGNFDIVFTAPASRPISVKIYDMEGRIVYANEFAGTNNNTLPIETSRLSPGNYSASITIDGAVVNKKITISK